MTVVPTSGAPLASVTLPLMLEVVTWAEIAVAAKRASIESKSFFIRFEFSE